MIFATFWSAFLAFFKGHKTETFLSAAIIILAITSYNGCNSASKKEQELKIANANFKAATDSIRVEFTKANQVEYEKYSYVAKTASDLKKVNDSLATAIKNIKGGTVIAAVNSGIKIVDTGSLKTVVVRDTVTNKIDSITATLNRTYSPGNYHRLQVTSYFSDSNNVTSILNHDEIGFTALTGIKKDSKGNYVIFVVPNYPGAKITELDGAYIDKSVFRPNTGRLFSVNATVGYLASAYDWRTHQLQLAGTQIGIVVGVSVDLIKLFK